MARLYGGTLGLIAFSACLASAAVHGESFAGATGRASAALALFAALGCLLGWLADGVVEDAVRMQLRAAVGEAAASADASKE